MENVFFFKETHRKVMEFFCHTSKKGVSIIIGFAWTLYGQMDPRQCHRLNSEAFKQMISSFIDFKNQTFN